MQQILVIDDNVNDILIVQRVLERAGFGVTWAANGEKGLEAAASKPPDCILVDYRMPGLNGYEVTRLLKADPVLGSIPVLMLTGADSPKNLVDGLDAGADDYVTKGSDLDVILARVKALLRVKAYQDRIVEQAGQLRALYDELSQKSDKIMALNQHLNNDLQVARRVQEALLPERVFRTPRAEIRSTYIPSETLSGDFYDYFQLSDSLYLFMADVSGHGLAAAIQVSLLKSYIHTETNPSESLTALMVRLNDFLFTATLPAQYATGQLFRIDADGSLVWSNAAHPGFLLYERKTNKTTLHEKPGHMLGALPGMSFDEHSLPIGSGDTLFAYTDGLTDRVNEAGDFYEIERISAILDASGGATLPDVNERIQEDIRNFSATDAFKDDIAFVLTRFA
ncbi:MAG TPA: fused response regulator/phosphatase [Thermoanaerobaculia bacterium]|nr:fused response regulator/phosphatase [Thermoanaerobaculia bacterium]